MEDVSVRNMTKENVLTFAKIMGLEGIDFEIVPHFVQFSNGEKFTKARVRKIILSGQKPTLNFPITAQWIKTKRPSFFRYLYSNTPSEKIFLTENDLNNITFHKNCKHELKIVKKNSVDNQIRKYGSLKRILKDYIFFLEKENKIPSQNGFEVNKFTGMFFYKDKTPFLFFIKETALYSVMYIIQTNKIFNIQREMFNAAKCAHSTGKQKSDEEKISEKFHKYRLARIVFETNNVAQKFLEIAKGKCKRCNIRC